MITPIRVLLLAAAGIASLAVVALRPRPAPVITRELDLASLHRHVANWLPKLPFVPYIRIGVPSRNLLELVGDGTGLQAQLLESPQGARDHRFAFRRTCARLGLAVIDDENGRTTACELPAVPAAAADVLATLLREVFDVDDTARLVAIIPGGD